MYVEKLYTYGNIISFNETISYYYKVRPISTLYAHNTQIKTSIENLYDKITKINMPGSIIIRARKEDVDDIMNDYEEIYLEYGEKRLVHMKDLIYKDTYNQLKEKVRYHYDIYVVFTDNRPELKKSKLPTLIGKISNDPLDHDRVEACRIIEDSIFKKMSVGLDIIRCSPEMSENLHNYLAVPVEQELEDYYVDPSLVTHLGYRYLAVGESEYKTLYSRVLIASKFDQEEFVEDRAETIINELQLNSYPVDTIIKFDLENTEKFRQNMTVKKNTIKKGQKRYFKTSGRKDRMAARAKMLAEIGENTDEAIEESKIRWQMMLRVYAKQEKMLSLRSTNLINIFASRKITLSYEIGSQEQLHNNLFPFNRTFSDYAQLTDIGYLCKFNLFGGLYLGEESGTILTYTQPGELPVRQDYRRTAKGQVQNESTTAISVGESGGGKSQFFNNEMTIAMTYYGMPVLAIDPKGDRYPYVELLGSNANHLILGGSKCSSGLFDVFLMFEKEEENSLIAKLQKDVMAFVRCINPGHTINLKDIKICYRDMRDDYQSGKIKRMTMKRFVEYYRRKDPLAADNLEGLFDDPMGKLFFADDETNNDIVFNMNKPFNLITFDKTPQISQFDPDNLEHQVFSLCTNRIKEIVYSFIRLFKGKMKYCLIDEFQLWKRIPGGLEMAVDLNRIARSELLFLRYISQLFSDFPDDILTNTGQFIIGSLKNEHEINTILDYFKLEENTTVKSALLDRTKDEGLDPDKKYNFLYIDPNNRKGLTKLKFMKSLETVFDTHMKDRVSEVK